MISVLLTQIIVILLAAWLGGRLFRYLGQPQVVGEMTVGLVRGQIGSGCLGSTDALNTISQIGLLLFLFLIGLRLNPDHLMRESRLALAVSAASIVAPFVLGSALGLVLYAGLQDGTSRTGFSLFLGAAMSVTAFPVLARILQERRMEATRVGTLAMACAAVNDVVAWSLLAGILAFVHSHLHHRPFWQTLVLVLAFSTAIWLGRGRLT